MGFYVRNCQQFLTKSLFMMASWKTASKVVPLGEVREEEHIHQPLKPKAESVRQFGN